MGGCGGKKARQKRAGTGPGGKFDSIGDRSQQAENLALVVRLMGEIGPDGERLIMPTEKVFLADCRIKINQMGTGATFGWRQVEEMVRIHAEVEFRQRKAREEALHDKLQSEHGHDGADGK